MNAGPVGGSADWWSSPRFAAVMQELAPLAERFADAGHRLFLVGGTVRDLVAGDLRDEVDLDATTTAHPTEIKRLLQGWADAIWTQGERFGTIGATKRTTLDDGSVTDRVFEITTHRAEAYRGDSRKPDVAFSDDVRADLSRRDFTVNAMAIEVTSPTPSLVDPFDGRADLAACVLRTPLTPAESFSDDPLRMLRAARFVTRYDLVPVPELWDAVRSMGARLEIVSAERVRDELDKLLRCATPAAGLRFVLDSGLAVHALPELTARAVVVAARVDPSARLARWAALFEGVDAAAARGRMRALRASTADVDGVVRLVQLRDTWFAPASVDRPATWTDAAVRRLVHAAGPRLDDLLALVEALVEALVDTDVATAPALPSVDRGASTGGGDERHAERARLDTLREGVRRVTGAEGLGPIEPELDGAAVMEVLGVPPGREVGRALAFLLELRLEEGLLGRSITTQRLVEWWTNHRK